MAFLKRKSKSEPPALVTIAADAPPAIDSLVPRQPSVVRGTVTRVKMRPSVAGRPSLSVQISDGSGSVTAFWTGRQEIGGLKIGGLVEIEGVCSNAQGSMEFMNPRYRLLPSPN